MTALTSTPVTIQLYNTATRRIEPLAPLEPGRVRLYACGPTVYKHAHIGNLRTYVFEDVLVRVLQRAGHAVTHVMNVTDVGHLQSDADEGEDKMALSARQEQRSPWDIARHYESEFFRHAALLNIRRPGIVCRATEHVDEMIAMVQLLQDKGFAYESGGNVYFDIAKFPAYADFAGLRLDELAPTERVETDVRKRQQADFALWFSQSKFPHQVMQWDSPWGRGFPGWHIECSAMAGKYLGEHVDIHCGGVDHVRVHHTNEIAQSECCFGHRWVGHWFHCDFLDLDSGKMSKSSGDVLTVDSLTARGLDPLAFRYLVLTSHYRGSLRFSFEAMDTAARSYAGLKRRVGELRAACGREGYGVHSVSADSLRGHAHARAFDAALLHDLRTPMAMAVVWAVLKDDGLTAAEKLALILEFDIVLGLSLDRCAPASDGDSTIEDDTGEIAALQMARAAARAARDWAEADRLRALLVALGVDVRDGKG
jgi:cysteinyl-tRNA synthetase